MWNKLTLGNIENLADITLTLPLSVFVSDTMSSLEPLNSMSSCRLLDKGADRRRHLCPTTSPLASAGHVGQYGRRITTAKYHVLGLG